MAYSVIKEFVTWLNSLGYSASTYPPKSGTEFVTVERTSGYVENMVDHPSIAIQAWAATEVRAAEMADEIRLAALTRPLPVGVHHITVEAGPYAFWDESTRLPRYQVVFDVTSQLTNE